MATSGTSAFTRTRNEIVHASARKVEAISQGEVLRGRELNEFNEGLNGLVKHLQGSGIHVWTTSEATLFPQVGQARYALSSSSTDHATMSYVAAELAVAGASGATSITLDDDDGIANGDHIGIVLDTGSLYWTTVNGTPSGNVVTLTAGLTGSAAAGNAVYAYTTKIVRPLKIVDARKYTPASGIESPTITMISRQEYQGLPNKAQRGSLVQAFYDPQLTTGYLNLSLVPSTVNELVNFTWHRPFDVFAAAGDTADFPDEWFQALVFNLAVVMAPEYSVPDAKMSGPYGIGTLAKQYLDEMSGFDREAEPVQFGIEMWA